MKTPKLKIQIDNSSELRKVIRVESGVNLSELFEALVYFLPDGGWKDFVIETFPVDYTWNNPIVIREIVRESHPTYPITPMYPLNPLYPPYYIGDIPYVFTTTGVIGETIGENPHPPLITAGSTFNIEVLR